MATQVNQPQNAQDESNEAAPEIVLIDHPNKVPDVYTPDLVRVRATGRGVYAVRKVVEDPQTETFSIAKNEIMRNVNDVFLMDTADMRKWPLAQMAPKGAITKKEYPHAGENGTIVIKTKRGQFELPSWVVLADERGVGVNTPTGHQTAFGKKDGEIISR